MKFFDRVGPVTGVIVAVIVVGVIAVVAAVGVRVFTGAPGAGTDGTDEGPSATSAPGAGHTPGVSSDLWGRRVTTPEGDVAVPMGQARTSEDMCAIEPEVSIQTSYGAQTLWSTSSGPSEVVHQIPTGYSRDATGAALAGWNLRAAMFAGGEVSREAMKNYLDFVAKQDEMLRLADSENYVRDTGMLGLLAPDAARVVTCKDDFMVIEMAHRLYGDESGRIDEEKWDVMRFTMKWDGGWNLDVPAMAQGGEIITNLDGWTPWQF